MEDDFLSKYLDFEKKYEKRLTESKHMQEQKDHKYKNEYS